MDVSQGWGYYGSNNSATISQTGTLSHTLLRQEGDDNSFTSDQQGDANIAEALQLGNDNTISITQTGTGSTDWSARRELDDVWPDALWMLSPNSEFQVVSIHQWGNNDSVIVSQTGLGNWAESSQSD